MGHHPLQDLEVQFETFALENCRRIRRVYTVVTVHEARLIPTLGVT
jgi:hypothetical protein